MGFYLICCITTFLLIDWGNLLQWSALPKSYVQLGLHLSRPNILTLIFAAFLHHSPMHLLYTGALFFIGLENSRDQLDQYSHNRLIILIPVAIIILPIIVGIISYLVALSLTYVGSLVMLIKLLSSFYIGSSMVAWSIIGFYKRQDWIIILAIVLPLFYKLFVTQLFDFTPDIAHISGYLLGRLVTR